jgi:hypothetical protein
MVFLGWGNPLLVAHVEDDEVRGDVCISIFYQNVLGYSLRLS